MIGLVFKRESKIKLGFLRSVKNKEKNKKREKEHVNYTKSQVES